MDLNTPYIINARMNSECAHFFTTLRAQCFPKERNYLSAHITLFNAIPESLLSEAIKDMKSAALANSETYTATFSDFYSIGGGVAIRVNCSALRSLRESLRQKWEAHLTPQDKAKNRDLHITIQNRVTPETAKETLEKVAMLQLPQAMHIEGLELHRYANGPWEFQDFFEFGA